MTPFGNRIRELRESKGLLQRQLAASLEIDTPMYSKIERGERKAKREQVEALAGLLKTESSVLVSIWLADQIMEVIKNEPEGLNAIKIVEQKLMEI